jgi:hypothetical protein
MGTALSALLFEKVVLVILSDCPFLLPHYCSWNRGFQLLNTAITNLATLGHLSTQCSQEDWTAAWSEALLQPHYRNLENSSTIIGGLAQ